MQKVMSDFNKELDEPVLCRDQTGIRSEMRAGDYLGSNELGRVEEWKSGSFGPQCSQMFLNAFHGPPMVLPWSQLPGTVTPHWFRGPGLVPRLTDNRFR